MNKTILRNLFNNTLRLVPSTLHAGLLKSYVDMPDLALDSGYRAYPQKYHSPLVSPHEVDLAKLETIRDLPGLKINLNMVFDFIKQISTYSDELDCLPKHANGKVLWYDTFTTLHSAVLYCAIRELKPQRYIEVGCGFSSRVSSAAIFKNRKEGHPCEATFIEPYPAPRLEKNNLAGDLLVSKIEDVPTGYFQTLNEKDIFFIDTSHVIKCQNDVEYELLHVLPSLKKGVYIHVHDIYTPYDQRKEYILGPSFYGAPNEQYALECLLSGGDTFETLLPLYMLEKDHPESVAKILNGVKDHGQSFWVRKNR